MLKYRCKARAVLAAIGAAFSLSVVAADEGMDTSRIEALTGLKGKLDDKEHVFTVILPRDDLKVAVAGARVTPPMGLTAWAAFHRAGSHDEVMGDIVLLEDQVNPVMSAALENGLEVTGLHNHFFWDTPKVWFMHIGGMGDETKLATAVGKVFEKLKETRDHPQPAPRLSIEPGEGTIDAKVLDAIIGASGEMKNGVYKVTLGQTTHIGGHAMGKAMGVNTWAAFAGAPEQSVVDGDFATLPGELQPVLKALRAANINVVAIHNHMVGEDPPVVFLHYWATGPAQSLAKGIRAALDTQH